MLVDVLNKVDEVKAKLAKHYAPFDFTVKVDELKNGRAGQASYFFNEIIISKHYLQEHKERILNVTVPHEICHLYVHKYYPKAKQAHGREFRMLMNYLGLDGDTYHNMQLSQATHKNKQRREKIRFIYETINSKLPVLLTKAQHQKMKVNPTRFYHAKTKEHLRFTGQAKIIK